MHQNDFDRFTQVLQHVAAVYSKKLDDVLIQQYWKALKDMYLPTIERLADQHMRYQKFFPKPFELRPREDPPARESGSDGGFHKGVEFCRRNWDERMQRDPELTRIELTIAKTDRIIAAVHESSPGYITALDENRLYREQRRLMKRDRA